MDKHESYVDSDGILMEWDPERHAYFPKIDDAVIASHMNNYGEEPWGEFVSPQGQVYYYNKKTGESSWVKPPGFNTPATAATSAWTVCKSPEGHTYYYNASTGVSSWERPADFPAEADAPALSASAAKDKVAGQKRRAKDDKEDPEVKTEAKPAPWTLPDEKNPYVYVTGLPLDITMEEFATYMSKCGIIGEDDEGCKKIKLYRDEEGKIKGDGRVCYLKVESVALAIQILDGSSMREGETISVSRAVFKARDDATAPADQKKRKKKKKNGKSLAEKLLSWHDVGDQREKSKKVAGVVILKNMFEPKEFDEDAAYLLDLKQDVTTECSKVGKVKKVMIFDKHPEGVVSVKFEEVEAVGLCISLMNGRNFAGRKITAEEWDGIVNYKIEETDLDREERLQKWEKYLDEDDKEEN